jgi:hypothetical protein
MKKRLNFRKPRSKLIHLLKPREFRVWCIQTRVPSQLKFTTDPLTATCANCLSVWRAAVKNNHQRFRVSHILNRPEEENLWPKT